MSVLIEKKKTKKKEKEKCSYYYYLVDALAIVATFGPYKFCNCSDFDLSTHFSMFSESFILFFYLFFLLIVFTVRINCFVFHFPPKNNNFGKRNVYLVRENDQSN